MAIWKAELGSRIHVSVRGLAERVSAPFMVHAYEQQYPVPLMNSPPLLQISILPGI